MALEAPTSVSDAVLIVGAGVFGLSTAYELAKRAYSNITVADRHLPPVADGNGPRGARGLACRVRRPFVMLAHKDSHPYLDNVRKVSKTLGVPLQDFDDARQVRGLYPAFQSLTERMQASVNSAGGWADAESSIRQLAMSCSQVGVSFVTGHAGTVTSLRRGATGQVTGVNVLSGGSISADQVILSTGAWTNRLVNIEHTASASGQPVGFIQLTHDEAGRLRGSPVIINSASGFFVFPVTPGPNILKVARHSYGFATEVQVQEGERFGVTVSSPKRDSSGVTSSFLPDDADAALREGLSQLIPEFGAHPWMQRRLCWYTDTPEGDFIVDRHPSLKGLFLATGGAGHAFKFLPVLGKCIADCFEDKASKEIRHQWRLRAPSGDGSAIKFGDGSHGGPPLRVLTRLEQAKL